MSKGIVYSLAFSKSGDAAFLSHLDTLRILERAVRRSGAAVCYTRGYNPHIRLSVPRALPVGLESEGEWFMMRLEEACDPEALRRALDRQMPEGFHVVKTVEGTVPDPGGGGYGLDLYYRGPRPRAEAAAERFLRRERIEVSGTRKGRPYRSDVRPHLLLHAVEEERIRFRIREGEGSEPRLKDLAAALMMLPGDEPIEIESVRVSPPGFRA